jgi:catechol-2,3-dioxygenase
MEEYQEMREGCQSLGWWMRRPTGFADDSLNDYYATVVGLPVLRQGGTATLFWAGEDLVFEIKTGDDPGLEFAGLGSAHLLPIFRSYELSATCARFTQAGYHVCREESSEYARTIWFVGEDNMPIGFEQRSAGSPFAADAEALRRWNSGETTRLPGVESLAPELQYLSRVRRRVADLDRAAEFYRNIAGFDSVGTDGPALVFSMGDTVLLELIPGGTARPVPTDRAEYPDTFISRIHGFDDYADRLTADGVTWVGEQIRYSTGSNLAYFADPEGLPIGIESRTLWGNYPEDVEAERRWARLTT